MAKKKGKKKEETKKRRRERNIRHLYFSLFPFLSLIYFSPFLSFLSFFSINSNRWVLSKHLKNVITSVFQVRKKEITWNYSLSTELVFLLFIIQHLHVYATTVSKIVTFNKIYQQLTISNLESSTMLDLIWSGYVAISQRSRWKWEKGTVENL